MGSPADGLRKQIEQRFGHVVRKYRAAGYADDRDVGPGPPLPAEEIGHTHAPGRIALHRVDAAIARASSRRDNGPGAGREPAKPLARGDRLASRGVGAEAGPESFALVALVRDRAFDDENEPFDRHRVAARCQTCEKLAAVLVRQDRRYASRILGMPGIAPEIRSSMLG